MHPNSHHATILLPVVVPTNPSHPMTSSTTSASRYETIKTLIAKQKPTNVHMQYYMSIPALSYSSQTTEPSQSFLDTITVEGASQHPIHIRSLWTAVYIPCLYS